MESLSVQILKTMGRWSVVLFLFGSQAAKASESFSSFAGESIWHNALFIFSICFFVAGFIFLLMMKSREEHKNKVRTHHLRHRHTVKH
jgi:cyanate permease